MRRAVAATLEEIAAADERVVVLTGDLGFMVLDRVAARFPERFVNVGVAEQNMVGIACGLAEAGFIPFVYSITSFAVLRPFEFLRDGPIHHHLPVRVLGIGCGVDYGLNGTSHYALEDLAVLRGQPGLTIVAPADSSQARAALQATWNLPGPVYYRIAKDDVPAVAGLDGGFALGRAHVVCRGRDVVLIALGTMAAEAERTARELASAGLSATVAVVASVQPPPVADLVELLRTHALACTIEAHYTTGGLGSLVADVIADHGVGVPLLRCGIPATLGAEVGSSRFLMERERLTAHHLAARVLDAAAGSQSGGALPVRPDVA